MLKMLRGLLLICFILVCVQSQINLEQHFENCHTSSPNFDNCVKDALNDLRPYFKGGLPRYGIGSFDPFFANEIIQKRRFSFGNYKLILRNVTESGWTASKVTKLKTDLPKRQIQVVEFFPDKRLKGWYEIEGTFFGLKIHNQGAWNLSLFDYIQTLTISRKPVEGFQNGTENPPIKVICNVQACKKLELHIGHLAGGRTVLENMLDWIINTAWPPGFILLSPLINDLVGTAFSEIFTKDFQNFPFEQVFHN